MNKIIKLGKAFAGEIGRKHIAAYASSSAFFMFISLIPIILLLCSLVPLTPISQADLTEVIREYFPEMIAPLGVSIISEMYVKSSAILSLSIVATLWSAGKGILALNQGLNVINEVKETRNYILLRIRACFYTVLMLLAIILTLLVIVFGSVIVRQVIGKIPDLQYLLEFFMSIRHVVFLVFLIILFVFMYSWLPNEKVNWRTQVPGAVLVASAWSAFSVGFSAYVNLFAGFGMYGSLSTIIMVMVWLYFCMYLILFGALVNRFLMPVQNYFINKKDQKKTEKSS